MTRKGDDYRRLIRLGPIMQADAHTQGISPVYFGDQSRPLFGCYQAPQGPVKRRTGVLMCYPVGPEYIRSHRAFRQLAVRLNRAGFGVMRYDHYGCGDSAGRFEECRLADWLDAIPLAIQEMRTKRGHTDVCVLGLTLGATLSLISTAKVDRVAGLILWDPMIDGVAYVQSLKDWQAGTIASGAIPERPAHQLDDTHTEVLGYAFSAELLDEISRIDPLAIERAPADRILVLETGGESRTASLREHLQHLGASVDSQTGHAPQTWRQEPYQAVIPHAVLTRIVDWIAEVFE